MSNAKKTTTKETTSLKDRDDAYKKTYRATGNRRAATRAYCSGNKWATENAKAVGNW